jgi:hypothetical protein
MSSNSVESPTSPPPLKTPPYSKRNEPWRCNAEMSSNSVESLASPPPLKAPPFLYKE